jgi:hypothetical protein
MTVHRPESPTNRTRTGLSCRSCRRRTKCGAASRSSPAPSIRSPVPMRTRTQRDRLTLLHWSRGRSARIAMWESQQRRQTCAFGTSMTRETFPVRCGTRRRSRFPQTVGSMSTGLEPATCRLRNKWFFSKCFIFNARGAPGYCHKITA